MVLDEQGNVLARASKRYVLIGAAAHSSPLNVCSLLSQPIENGLGGYWLNAMEKTSLRL